MKILFLDDSMARWDTFRTKIDGHEVKWASFYDEGVRLVCEHKDFDMIMLDHDLSDADYNAPTGYDFVKYMVDNNIKARYVVCHSMNPSGRANMCAYLKNNGYNVCEVHFAWTLTPTSIVSKHFTPIMMNNLSKLDEELGLI